MAGLALRMKSTVILGEVSALSGIDSVGGGKLDLGGACSGSLA